MLIGKKKFILTYVGLHAIFAFLQIYKQSAFIKLSYQKQKNEQILAEITQQQKNLFHNLEIFKNSSDIKRYAQNNLKMVPVKLENIKHLEKHISC